MNATRKFGEGNTSDAAYIGPAHEDTFAQDTIAFLAEIPTIQKTVKVDVIKQGRKLYDYYYTPLSEIMHIIKPIAAKHGLGIVQNTSTTVEGGTAYIGVETVLLHKSGRTQSFGVLRFPLIGGIHDLGGIVTYVRRQSANSAFAIAPADEDLDAKYQADLQAGATGEPEYIAMPEEAYEALATRINEAGSDATKILKLFPGVGSLRDLSKDQYDSAMEKLAVKIAERKKGI